MTFTPSDSMPPRYDGIRPITFCVAGTASIVRRGSTASPEASIFKASSMTPMHSATGMSAVTSSWFAISTFITLPRIEGVPLRSKPGFRTS